jgi:hypothetical protein
MLLITLSSCTRTNWAGHSDVHQEHWCWSGHNAKGKWGIFPQTFIDTNTLQDPPPTFSDGASIMTSGSGEKQSRGKKMLSQFSIRKSSGRQTSISEAVISPTMPPSSRPRPRDDRMAATFGF